ncbi:MAG: hypothetical protein BPHS0_16 [Phage 5P_3]|nr:MAG: hypothetical protein BPHS0_16 [Phage 5P_3]
MPSWYSVIRAARYLNVPPWELASRPSVWTDWALASESAENAAEHAAANKVNKKK